MNTVKSLMLTIGFGILVSSPVVAEKPTLDMLTWGGSYEEAQNKAFFNDFEKEYNVDLQSRAMGDSILGRIRAESEHPGGERIDLVDISAGALAIGCDENLLLPIHEEYQNADGYIDGAIKPCGVANSIWAVGVVSRPTETEIDSAEDFFDPSIEGARGLKRHPRTTLELALLGAGVPKDEIYDVLRTEEGIQLAFDTLDKIKDRIKWWQYSSQASNLLMSGNVVATTVYTARMVHLKKFEGADNFKIHWNSHVRGYGYFAIPKHTDNQELAKELVKYATGPKNNGLSKYSGHSSVRKDQPNTITDDYPTHEDNMDKAIVQSDVFWSNHQDQLTERFNSWLSK